MSGETIVVLVAIAPLLVVSVFTLRIALDLRRRIASLAIQLPIADEADEDPVHASFARFVRRSRQIEEQRSKP